MLPSSRSLDPDEELGLVNLRHDERSQQSARRIAVIGAGPAGLVTAKTLIEAGAAVTVYEAGSRVGGTWVFDNDNGRQFLYRALHINTPKRLTAFSDFPFPNDTQPIPSHLDMARYMRSYAEQFGLLPRIRFNSPVTSVRRDDSGRWRVTFAQEETRDYDAVVVCVGLFDRPHHESKLKDSFEGIYIHSAEYRSPEAFLGQRVCVVGAGNSAVDIASDVCRTASQTVLIARSPVNIIPHFVLGVGLGDISAGLRQRWIPDAFRRFVLKWLTRMVHGRMTDYGFAAASHRLHPTISSTIVQDILFRRVTVQRGIERIDGRTLTFTDGSKADFDVLIASTGYATDFPFLPTEIVPRSPERLRLFKRIVPPNHPGLYFVGMINLDTPINYACEKQAKWITAIECGAAVLPARELMLKDIERKDRWALQHYGKARRHSVQEESKSYYRELDRSLHMALQRDDLKRFGRSQTSRRDAKHRSKSAPYSTPAHNANVARDDG
jgi:hypothetical protein